MGKPVVFFFLLSGPVRLSNSRTNEISCLILLADRMIDMIVASACCSEPVHNAAECLVET